MKRSKLACRLASALLTGAMVISMGGMTAFAAADSGTQDVTFKKVISKGENIYTPAVGTISFTVAPVTVSEGADTDKNGQIVYSGVEGGLTLKSGASFTVAEDLTETRIEKDVTLEIDKSKFVDGDGNWKPGIYRYSVQETAHNYDGLSVDSNVYYMDVYVSETAGVKTYETYMYNSTDSDSGKVGSVENTYTTHDLTVQKKVAGNQGDPNKEFNFTITIQGAAGETYYTVNGDTVSSAVCDTDGIATITVSLHNDETILIKGLSANDSYKIVEEDYSTDGYTKTEISGYGEDDEVTYKDTDKNVALEINGKVADADETIIFTNTKSVTTPTGVAMTFAPYILLVAAAGVFAILFLRRRREEF